MADKNTAAPPGGAGSSSLNADLTNGIIGGLERIQLSNSDGLHDGTEKTMKTSLVHSLQQQALLYDTQNKLTRAEAGVVNENDDEVDDICCYNLMKIAFPERVNMYVTQAKSTYELLGRQDKGKREKCRNIVNGIKQLPWDKVPIALNGESESVYIGVCNRSLQAIKKKNGLVTWPKKNQKHKSAGQKQFSLFIPKDADWECIKGIYKLACKELEKYNTIRDFMIALVDKLLEDDINTKLITAKLPTISKEGMTPTTWGVLWSMIAHDIDNTSSIKAPCPCLNTDCHRLVCDSVSSNIAHVGGLFCVSLECSRAFLGQVTKSTVGSYHANTVLDPDSGERMVKGTSGLISGSGHATVFARLAVIFRGSPMGDQYVASMGERSQEASDIRKKMLANPKLREQYLARKRAECAAARAKGDEEDSYQPGLPRWMLEHGILWSEKIMREEIDKAKRAGLPILFYFCDVSIDINGRIKNDENTRSIWQASGSPFIRARTHGDGNGRCITKDEIGGLTDQLIRVKSYIFHCVGGKQSETLERGLTYNALNDLEFRGLIANAKCGGPQGIKCDSACVLNVFYVGESLKDDKIGFNKKSLKSRRRRIKDGFEEHGWGKYFKQVVEGGSNTYTDISDDEDEDDVDDEDDDDVDDNGMKNNDYEEEEDEEDYYRII